MAIGFYTYKVYFRRSNGDVGVKLIDAQGPEHAEYDGRRYGRVIRVAAVSQPLYLQVILMMQMFLNRISPDFLRNLYSWNRKGFTFRQRVEFLQSLSNMLRGYKLSDALAMLSQNFTGDIREACRQLRHSCVNESKEITDALRELGPRYIPGVTLAIIAINSKVGSAADAFKEGLKFERDMAAMESGYIIKALLSMFWFVVTILSIWVMDAFGWEFLDDFNYFAVMPQEGESKDMLDFTRVLLHWSNVVGLSVLAVWSIAVVLIGAGRDVAATVVEKWILKIPVVRGAMLNRINFVACYQVHKLLSKGVSLMESFQYVAAELPEGVLKEDFTRVLNLLGEGSTEWQDGFHSFGDLERALLKSSTNQDEIAETFDAQADQFLFHYQRSVDLFTYIHIGMTGVFMVSLVLILALLMFIPMAGGFEMVDQL